MQTSVGEEVSTINDECRRVNPQFKGEFARFAVDRGRGAWANRGTIVVDIAEYRLPRQAKSASRGEFDAGPGDHPPRTLWAW